MELLIVVAVIALLVSILLPAMRKAKLYAIKVKCLTNLNGIADALHLAGGDLESGFPPAGSWTSSARQHCPAEMLLCPKGGQYGAGTAPGPKGDLDYINPPPTVYPGKLEDTAGIKCFCETVNFTLPTPVTVDVTEPGDYKGSGGYGDKPTVPAGTAVDSYFIHYDPTESGTYTGSFTFTREVVGILCASRQLNDTDWLLGHPDVEYPSGVGARGYEGEEYSLSEDRRTITFHRVHASSPGDQMRVLTRPGGDASYGLNILVDGNKDGHSDQLLLIEYEDMLVDVGTPWFAGNVARRHEGEACGAFFDGSARVIEEEELDPEHPVWQSHGGG